MQFPRHDHVFINSVAAHANIETCARQQLNELFDSILRI
jgi:hypothetical protein